MEREIYDWFKSKAIYSLFKEIAESEKISISDLTKKLNKKSISAVLEQVSVLEKNKIVITAKQGKTRVVEPNSKTLREFNISLIKNKKEILAAKNFQDLLNKHSINHYETGTIPGKNIPELKALIAEVGIKTLIEKLKSEKN